MDFSVLKEWIAGNTAGMIALETLLTSHPALAPESGGEGELKKVLALETWLKEQGITQLERFDAPDNRVESGIRPNLVATITGADDAVKATSDYLLANGVRRVVPLAVSGAFHSKFMENAGKEFEGFVAGLELNNAKIELLKEKLNNLEINENDFNRKKKVFIANAIVDFENAYQVNNEIRSSILKYNKILNDIPSSIENLKFDKFAKVKDNLGNETAYVILKPIKKEE